MWAVLSPFSYKREGDSSLFCALTRRKFFLRLSIILWGQFYVTERFCNFLKRHNLLIKLQPWLTFLWTTFCPCFISYCFMLHTNLSLFFLQTSKLPLNLEVAVNMRFNNLVNYNFYPLMCYFFKEMWESKKNRSIFYRLNNQKIKP